MRFLLGLLGVVALVMIGVMDSEEPQRCPVCGVEAVYSRYMGHGKLEQYACSQCGAELRKRWDNRYERVTM